MPDDSAVSRDTSQCIDVSDYKQAESQQEALEFWFVDMRPLAQSYLSPPPSSICSISTLLIKLITSQLHPCGIWHVNDAVLGFYNLVYSHPEKNKNLPLDISVIKARSK